MRSCFFSGICAPWFWRSELITERGHFYSLQNTPEWSEALRLLRERLPISPKKRCAPHLIAGHRATREPLFELWTDGTLRSQSGSTIFLRSPGMTFPPLHKEGGFP